MSEATPQGATIERLVGILGASESTPESQPEAAETAKPEEKPEVTEVEAEETTEEAKAAVETEEAVEQKEDAEEVVELPSTLSELAEALGIDPEKLYDIKAKTKVDGEEGEATLAQLLKSYQLEGHLTRKSMELSDQRKAFEQEAQKAKDEATHRIQYLQDAIGITHNLLNERFGGINWEQLKLENPTEYNAKYIELQQHQQSLHNAFNALNTERQKEQLLAQQQLAERVKEENKKLVNKIPEWADEAIAKKEQGQIRDYLKESGFSPEEIGQIVDHRHVVILREALKARQLQKSKPEVMKKVVQAPKLVKPGTKPVKNEILRDRLRDLRNKHKSGNKRAGVDFLIQAGLAD